MNVPGVVGGRDRRQWGRPPGTETGFRAYGRAFVTSFIQLPCSGSYGLSRFLLFRFLLFRLFTLWCPLRQGRAPPSSPLEGRRPPPCKTRSTLTWVATRTSGHC